MRRSCLYLTLPGILTAAASFAAAADDPGFRPIFDGKTLTGWKGDESFWRVEDGAVVAESTDAHPCKQNTFLLWDQGEVDDFILKLEYKISGTDAANSGIQFRGQQRADGHVVGYQADLDKGGQWVGSLYDEAMPRKQLAARGQKTEIDAQGERKSTQFADAAALYKDHVKPDDWNEYMIEAKGNHLTLSINGTKTAEVIDAEPGAQDLIGKLALQLHSGPPMKIAFRNIRLKRLPLTDGRKKIVFVAGTPSHPAGAHEHNAGCLLLASKLNAAAKESGLPVVATVYTNGWPSDPTAMDNVDCVVSYCDGGVRHYLNDRLEDFDHLVQTKHVGLVCVHFGVETTPGKNGDYFLKWIGGFFEPFWSVNPHWTAHYTKFPNHPVSRGVQPFEIEDEWYYHMRFVPDMKGVTPILTDLPPRESLSREDGHHSGNPAVREAVLQKKEPQHMAWAYERPDGTGRGFGFTGGHFHSNWQNDQFRKVVLNAIVWAAGLEVPQDGVQTATPTDAEIQANQDEKPVKKPAAAKESPPQGKPAAQAAPVPAAGAVAAAGGTQNPTRRDRNEKKTKPEPVVNSAETNDAAHAIEQLKVHPDLEATLFASEPMMTNPSSIDVDHLGRVWVVEAINYRDFRNADVIGGPNDGDRILVLEDTDGDGKADRSTTFYQGHDVDSAHGILVLPGAKSEGQGVKGEKGKSTPALRVLISALDKVFWLIDDDGDLHADRKEDLFTGIQGSQHDHGIHAVHFGPDGKLYFNFGNAGERISDKTGQTIVDKAGNQVNNSRNPYQEGMVFRCNLDGSGFETLAWNFRNNWELCVDSFGTIWQSDNDDDGNFGVRINYVMPYGNYGYKDELTGAGWREPRTGWEEEIPRRHWHLNDPGVVPNLLQTGAGAPTGICVYEGDALPAVFRGSLIHCDAGVNVCRAYVTKPVGAGFTAEMVNILDGSANQWFRPSDVCVAPDGSLFVADWYDPGVGGHRMGDIAHGRVFRVTARERREESGEQRKVDGTNAAQRGVRNEGRAGSVGKGGSETKSAGYSVPGTEYRVPAVDVSTAAGAVAAIKSPNMAARSLGWTALREMGLAARTAVLELTKSDNPAFRARGLWVLGKLGLPHDEIVAAIERGLRDPDPRVGAAAIRLGRELAPTIPCEAYESEVSLENLSIPVCREVLLALRDTEVPAMPLVWMTLAQRYNGQDRWYLEALGIAAEKNWDNCLNLWLQGAGAHFPQDKAARDIVWRSRATKTPRLLSQLIVDPNTPSEELPRYFRALDFQSGKDKPEIIRELAFGAAVAKLDAERQRFVRAEALNRLDRINLEGRPEQQAALDSVLDAGRGTEQFVRLIGKFKVQSRYPELLALAQEQPRGQLAVESLDVLLSGRQQDLIRQALTGEDRELAEKTFAALETAGEPRANEMLLALMQDETQPLWLRRSAVKALGASLPGAQRLLGLAQKGEYAEPLKDTLAATLSGVQWRSVREIALQTFPAPPGKDAQPLPPINELAGRTGDAVRGSVLFHSTATCAQCHMVGTLGKEVGPNLSEIGKKLTRTALWESILYPSAAISHNYENWLVVDVDGNQLSGLLVSETGDGIELKDNKGIVRKVPAASIELLKKQDISLMPADLQKTVDVVDLVDVVEFLTTLKEAKRGEGK